MQRISSTRLILPVLVALALVSAPAFPFAHSFPTISLLGSSEVPAVSSDGSGTANVVYNDATDTLYYTVVYTLDSSSTQLTAAHFHGPANASMNAGVQITITPATTAVSDVFSGSATLTASQEADLLAGLWYINLHSDQFGAGELRGQVIEVAATQSFADRPVDQAQVVNSTTGTPPGVGVFNGTYNSSTNALTFAYTWNSLTGIIIASHFHGPAAPGVTAGTEITITTLPGFETDPTGLFVSTVTLTGPQEADLLAGLWYVNVHTVTNFSGEVRGQVDGAATVPVELSVFAVE